MLLFNKIHEKELDMIRSSKWITSPGGLGTVSPEYRKEYTISDEIASVTAQISAAGIYCFFCNGERVGNYCFTPGWTSHEGRVQYQTYDITDLVKKDNSFSIVCANGWVNGRIALKRQGINLTDEIAVIAEIKIKYANGRIEYVRTDDTWNVYTTRILFSDFYDGETFDFCADKKLIGRAVIDTRRHPKLVPQIGEYVVERERVAAVSFIVTPKGERVIDFGQNIAGYAEIKTSAPCGSRIVISHAEVLDAEGNFYTENMRSAKNLVTYVTDGGERTFKPTFSFQGFRYIRLDEFPDEEIQLESFTAIAVYSDLRRTGYFSCGYEKLNQLYSNIIWGQRGNFIDVPTDCPQRDERLGWTGDAEVFCRTAAINYDVERFFRKWLGDMALDQSPEGGINGTIPFIPGRFHRFSAAWGDAATICPWEMYRAYGNKDDLRASFGMMKKWVEYMRNFGDEEYLFVGGNHFGDWLALDAEEGQCIGATQTDLIASAYYAFSTQLVIYAGQALGEDVSEYEALYAKVREAFRAAFMKNGLPTLYPTDYAEKSGQHVFEITQTGIALILRFALCNEDERPILIAKLADMIAENDGRMSTGFVGTPHILHVLSENGRADLAFDLLLQEKCPSWLFSVNHGATTIWEHWDSRREDGSFWSASMNSFNHYAYGAVYDWMFGVMLGIQVDLDGAGYGKITYAPTPDRRIGHACGSIESRRGLIASSWVYLPDGRVRYELTVPTGTAARVQIPGVKERIVSGGSFTFIA